MENNRMCMVCRERKPKEELLRIARIKGAAPEIDEMRRVQGRGMYICRSGECLLQARRRRVIERALGCADTNGVYELLEREAER